MIKKRDILSTKSYFYCLGTQFKWKFFLRFCVRFLTINELALLCFEKTWLNDARGSRADSVG